MLLSSYVWSVWNEPWRLRQFSYPSPSESTWHPCSRFVQDRAHPRIDFSSNPIPGGLSILPLCLYQCFLNFNKPTCYLGILLKVQILIQRVRGGVSYSALLISDLVMRTLLVHQSHIDQWGPTSDRLTLFHAKTGSYISPEYPIMLCSTWHPWVPLSKCLAGTLGALRKLQKPASFLRVSRIGTRITGS